MILRLTKCLLEVCLLLFIFSEPAISREPPDKPVRTAISTTAGWISLLPLKVITPTIAIERAFSNKLGLAVTARVLAVPSTFSTWEDDFGEFDMAYKLEIAPQIYISENWIDSIFVSPFLTFHYAPNYVAADFLFQTAKFVVTAGCVVGRNWVWRNGFIIKFAGGLQFFPMGSPIFGDDFPAILPAIDFRLGYAW